MNSVEVYDDFLLESDYLKIKEVLTSSGILPWFFNDYIVEKNGKEEIGFQFIHNFYIYNLGFTSENAQILLEPFFKKINIKNIHRVKANLGARTLDHEQGGLHTDFNKEDLVCKTAIYFVNTNNGYTLFKDGTKVESKANRFVVFPSTLEHTGVSQTDEKIRCLINFNYTEKE
jgi:hypothetical protein